MTTDTLDQEPSPSPATPKKARRPRRQPKADAPPRAPRVQRTHAEKRAAALRELERVDAAALERVVKQADRAYEQVRKLGELAAQVDHARARHMRNVADDFLKLLLQVPAAAPATEGTPAP